MYWQWHIHLSKSCSWICLIVNNNYVIMYTQDAMESSEWNIIPKANRKISGSRSRHAGKNKLVPQLSILFRKCEHSNMIFLNIHEGHTRMSDNTESKIVQLLDMTFFKSFRYSCNIPLPDLFQPENHCLMGTLSKFSM